FAEPWHWNQAVMLRAAEALKWRALDAAVAELVAHHDALRLRFTQAEDGTWRQHNEAATGHEDSSSSGSATVHDGGTAAGREDAARSDEGAGRADALVLRVDLSALADAQQSRVQSRVAGEVQRSLHLETGPLVRVAVFIRSDGERVLVVTHHLVVDGVSWRILLEDLEAAYAQAVRGERISLPAKTSSFQQWAQRLERYGREPERMEELDYWLGEREGWGEEEVGRVELDHEKGENTVESARVVVSELDEEETRALLQDVPGVYGTQIQEALMTGLVGSLAKRMGRERWVIEMEGHGREEIFEEMDVTRTVGWFTTLYPVMIEVGGSWDAGKALKSVKEQLRQVPGRGLGYGLWRYMNDGEKAEEGRGPKSGWPKAEISFNYLGQFDQTTHTTARFHPTTESVGRNRSPSQRRTHLLDIGGSVEQGRLRMRWIFSEHYHRSETIEALAQEFVGELRRLIAHCQSADAGGYTPSDFTQVNLSQDELDELMAELGELAGE
ncbi:MAG: condensation domain-containing protein, partial [Pyrinomonadaceae bacterium]